MLNAGKKFRALRDKKNKNSNSWCPKKTKQKTIPPPPPFKLNGRSLIDRRHFCVCKFEVFRGVGHLCNTFVFLCTIVSWFL